MQYYGAAQLADSFSTVRKNTIQVAEDIPEEKYGFRPAEGVRSIAETLAHIAALPPVAREGHNKRISAPTIEMFQETMQKIKARESSLRTKSDILEFLRKDGEEHAAWLRALPEEMLAETVTFPRGEPSKRTRFEALLGMKEHEMHHRGQLMLVERILGIVPHLTRRYQEQMAAMEAEQKAQPQHA
jgi:uncharacterized damage-inducible protein DinB